MSEPWLLVDGEALAGAARVVLDEAEARHVRDVLRSPDRDRVVLVDGQGTIAQAELVRCGRSRVEAVVLECRHVPAPQGAGVELVLGMLHGRAMDWAVQKAVEIGVRRFVPLDCERAQLPLKAVRARHSHWCRVARQALKQCRRPWQMEVASPLRVDELAVRERAGMVADPEGATWPEVRVVADATLVVGPEGGLSPDELTRLVDAGWTRLRLGPHTLRAETAAIVGAAFLVNACPE